MYSCLLKANFDIKNTEFVKISCTVKSQIIPVSKGKARQEKIWILGTVAGKLSFSQTVFTAVIRGKDPLSTFISRRHLPSPCACHERLDTALCSESYNGLLSVWNPVIIIGITYCHIHKLSTFLAQCTYVFHIILRKHLLFPYTTLSSLYNADRKGSLWSKNWSFMYNAVGAETKIQSYSTYKV
jgi:hypothetical protein